MIDGILRFPEAVAHEPAIDGWLGYLDPELGAIARAWFTRMRACGSDVTELLHDGHPIACVEDAPFAYVDAFRAHVNVGFFYGAELADPARLLEGTGRRMRHAKLRPGVDANAAALQSLIDAAYADVRVRLEIMRGAP